MSRFESMNLPHARCKRRNGCGDFGRSTRFEYKRSFERVEGRNTPINESAEMSMYCRLSPSYMIIHT